MSLSLGFAYYLRRLKEGSYESNQIEMQDTQLPFDEENEKKLSPRQLNWLQQNFVSPQIQKIPLLSHLFYMLYFLSGKTKTKLKEGPRWLPYYSED